MQYEAICAFHPNTAEEKLEALLTRFKERIENAGGKVGDVNKQGLKELAYKFQKEKSIHKAYFVHMTFEGGGRTPNELRNFIGVTEEVVRHIITRVN